MYRVSKRLLDIILSLLALCVLAIPLLIVMMVLRMTGEGDVWYFQERIGQGGRRFKLVKFCTMRRDSETTGTRDITLRNDPRVFPVGRILRVTKVNELPQLFNIVKGDMSVVGWRPLTPRPFACYPPEVQQQIVECLPGLTGVGSIIFRDEEGIIARKGKPPEQTYKDDIAPYKGTLEIWYKQNRSFWLDMKIIFLTAWVIMFRGSRLYERWLKGLPPRPASLDTAPVLDPGTQLQVAAQVIAGVNPIAERIAAKVRHVIGDRQVLLHAPCMDGRTSEYLLDCVKTAWVSTSGAYVGKLEQMLTDYTGARHVIATVNGTSALHTSLVLAGVDRGDEVLCPALTFVATANAVSYCGAIPHFCDVDRLTMGVDPARLDQYLCEIASVQDHTCLNKQTGRRISALLVMHTLGHPADMDGLGEVARRWHLAIVEDAAAGLGSYYKGKHVGRFGRFGALSFNSNKIITTGGGGAILTDDPILAEKAHHLTTQGKLPHSWRYVHDEVGWNYRMPNINAAVGCAQMERLPVFRDRKRRLAAKYHQAFAGDPDVTTLVERQDCCTNYWLNTVILNKADPVLLEAILQHLNDSGIQSRPIWKPMHRLKMYCQCPRMDMSVTDDLAARVLCLPSGSGLID